jgi:hypothetical protein
MAFGRNQADSGGTLQPLAEQGGEQIDDLKRGIIHAKR